MLASEVYFRLLADVKKLLENIRIKFNFGRAKKPKYQYSLPVEQCIQKKEEKKDDGDLAVLPENEHESPDSVIQSLHC